MGRPETATTATNRYLAGLPLDGDDFAQAKASVIRALADQVDNAKGSDNPSIVRSVPTLARQLSAELDELADHFAPPAVESDASDLLRWIMDQDHDDVNALVLKLGLSEAERRFLANESASDSWRRTANDLPIPTL